MAPPRILLCGDVLGRLNQLCKRVQSVNKSAGPFDALFCVGQFFPDSPELLEEFMEYIDGRSQIPLPTYFIGDFGFAAPNVLSSASRNFATLGFKMDGFKIADNLFWLKGSGKFTLHGLSIVYLSGRKSLNVQQFGTYSQDDVDALRAFAEEPGIVDLFLTNEWPTGVLNRASTSEIPMGVSDSEGSDSTVSELVAEIKPRYHIAGTKGVFYAREPYLNIDAAHVTRFLGLASVGNKDKQKFIHAISPTPGSTMTPTEISMKPTNTTLSPYMLIEETTSSKEVNKRPSDSASDSQYWRYDVSQKRHKTGADGDKLCFMFISSGSCPRKKTCHFQHDMHAREQYLRGVCSHFLVKGKCGRGADCQFKHNLVSEGDADRSGECWFCLSSPSVQSHLIVNVGETFYCALAKGPLVEDHVLLIPIEHLPSTLSLPRDCESELVRLKSSLKLYCKKRGKEAILFEWASKRVPHANLQVVPVPLPRAAAVRDIFTMAAEKLGFKFVKVSGSDWRKQLRAQVERTYGFFYAELPDGTVLSHSVEENEKFPVQFGREVLAGLLNVPDKADWRTCTLSVEEGTKMAEEFRRQFEELGQMK